MIRKPLCLFALVWLSLSGCSHIDPKIYSQDGPVADGDMLVEGSQGEPKHLMPPLAVTVTDFGLDYLVFDGLARYDENFNPIPDLAERWTISKDGKVITYYLRKGVRFHDGVEFTAADVLFTYQVNADPKVNSTKATYYEEIKNVEALDPYTVRVNFKKPYPPALGETFDMILPKHLLEGQDINKSDFDRHLVGTGPYKFKEWKTGQQIVLEANPDYWAGKPHVQEIVMKIIPDQTTEFLELLNGGIDALGPWFNGGSMTTEQYVKDTENPKIKDFYNLYKTNSFGFSYIGWNLKNPLFQDKKVRQALTMAIDRQTIVQNVLFGQGEVSAGPFHTWAVNPDVKPWPYDPAKAKEYLKEAGWLPGPDGILHKTIAGKDRPFKFTLLIDQEWIENERTATIVQQQLKQVGIQVDLQSYEWAILYSQFLEPRKFDAFFWGWIEDPDPSDNYILFHSSQTGENQSNTCSYSNPQANRLLEEGRETLDLAKRKKIYRKLHSILQEDQPFTFLYTWDRLIAIHKRFKGYRVNPNGVFIHPEQWYVPAAQQKYSVKP